ncbi:MAG: response regulator transcription factor [Verrucomicrobiota bacterium]
MSTLSKETNPPTGSRLLMIDDDREFCELVRDYLSAFGYTVSLAHTGPAGVAAAADGPWQAIILDVMLPGLDGFEVLRKIRRQSDVPVLMLTARGDEMDQIAGLEIGADDYLPKGSSTRQLLARLHAITRRAAVAASATPAAGGAAAGEIVIADLRIQPESRTASVGGQPLTLTPGEFDMLLSMARAKGRVKTRDALLAEIRDREWEVFDRAIDVQISALRRKLGDDPKNPRFIRTVRSAGYMMMDPDTAMG